MGAGGGPPRGASIIHHGADELLIQHDSVPDGEITLPVQEWTQHAHRLSGLLSNLIDVRRPGEIFVKGYPEIASGVDLFDWFPEECNWSGLGEAPSGTRECYCSALRQINGDSPFTQPPLKVIEI